ncbi:MAG: twitching motility protein PilT [Patescibacteria group bacterium]|nr:twitching motility protein PilT [Patescibacteria group bacterium]
MDYQIQLKQLLDATIKNNASDLHFSEGHFPAMRISRDLVFLDKVKKLSAEDSKGLAFALMSEKQTEEFLKEKEIDFSYSFEGRARFRVNVFFQMEKVSASLRLIPETIKSIEELNLPIGIRKFLDYSHGLILVVGPSSHGKSSTLAAIIDEINGSKPYHIITIEDPVEYVFKKKKSIISQRELHTDTKSFARALKSSLREDPNVIMVGEMRDPETIAAAITAAETGHLVFATLHTNSAAQTIHRIVDSFQGAQQSQIRAQIASSLVGIISQRLIPASSGGVVPVCEMLFNNSAISNLIRDNKVYEIPLVIDTSFDVGMVSLDRSLAELVRKGKISIDNAIKFSNNPRELKKII